MTTRVSEIVRYIIYDNINILSEKVYYTSLTEERGLSLLLVFIVLDLQVWIKYIFMLLVLTRFTVTVTMTKIDCKGSYNTR